MARRSGVRQRANEAWSGLLGQTREFLVFRSSQPAARLGAWKGIGMVEDSSTYWKKSRVELRAAGFDPDRAANTSAVITIASA